MNKMNNQKYNIISVINTLDSSKDYFMLCDIDCDIEKAVKQFRLYDHDHNFIKNSFVTDSDVFGLFCQLRSGVAEIVSNKTKLYFYIVAHHNNYQIIKNLAELSEVEKFQVTAVLDLVDSIRCDKSKFFDNETADELIKKIEKKLN